MRKMNRDDARSGKEEDDYERNDLNILMNKKRSIYKKGGSDGGEENTRRSKGHAGNVKNDEKRDKESEKKRIQERKKYSGTKWDEDKMTHTIIIITE